MATSLGLDIGTRHVRAALLKETRTETIILNHKSIPRNEWDLQGPNPFFARTRLPASRIIATFPSSLCSFRTLSLPAAGKSHLRDALKYAIEELIPHPLEDVVVASHPPLQTEGKQTVLAAAALKHDLTQHIAQLHAAGLELAGVVPDAAALSNLYRIAPHDTGETVAFLDIGSSSSTLAVCQQDTPPYVRSMKIGGDAFTTALAEELRVGEEQAEEAKARLQTLPDPLKSLTRHLATELSRAFLLAPADTPVAKLWLCGGGALLAGLPEELSSTLNIPVEIADVLAWLGARDRTAESPLFATAIGAAISGTRPRIPFNLLQDEFRAKTRFEKIAAPLVLAIILTFLSLASLTTSRLILNRRLSRQLAHTLAQERAIADEILKQDATGSTLYALLHSKLNQLQSNALDRAPLHGISALAVLREFANRVSSSGIKDPKDLTIENLSITQEGMTANMKVLSPAHIDAILDSLNASDLFRNADAPSRTPVEGGIRFSLHAAYTAGK